MTGAQQQAAHHQGQERQKIDLRGKNVTPSFHLDRQHGHVVILLGAALERGQLRERGIAQLTRRQIAVDGQKSLEPLLAVRLTFRREAIDQSVGVEHQSVARRQVDPLLRQAELISLQQPQQRALPAEFLDGLAAHQQRAIVPGAGSR